VSAVPGLVAVKVQRPLRRLLIREGGSAGPESGTAQTLPVAAAESNGTVR